VLHNDYTTDCPSILEELGGSSERAEADHRRHAPFPVRLIKYMASSARFINSWLLCPCSGNRATPTDMLTDIGPSVIAMGSLNDATTLSAIEAMLLTSFTPGAATTNSSPPTRAT